MISIVKFYNTAMNLLRSGTTGDIELGAFIDTTNQEQVNVQKTLVNFYEENQAVKDLLKQYIKSQSSATNSGGLLTFQADYVRFLAVLDVNGKPAYPINVNEVSTIAASKIRTPNVAKGNIFYYQQNGSMNFMPAMTLQVLYNYLRKPNLCALVGTPVSTPDNDYLNLTGAVDLEWPDEAFDLLLYSVLKKLGFSLKDELTMQFAQLNISEQQLNTQPV